jgi:hypothetical protein
MCRWGVLLVGRQHTRDEGSKARRDPPRSRKCPAAEPSSGPTLLNHRAFKPQPADHGLHPTRQCARPPSSSYSARLHALTPPPKSRTCADKPRQRTAHRDSRFGGWLSAAVVHGAVSLHAEDGSVLVLEERRVSRSRRRHTVWSPTAVRSPYFACPDTQTLCANTGAVVTGPSRYLEPVERVRAARSTSTAASGTSGRWRRSSRITSGAQAEDVARLRWSSCVNAAALHTDREPLRIERTSATPS